MCCTAASNVELMCRDCNALGGLGKTLPHVFRNDDVCAVHPLPIKCCQNFCLHISVLPHPSSTTTHWPPAFVTNGLLLSFLLLNVKLLTTSFLSERQMVTHSPSHLCIQERAAPLQWHSANKPWGMGRDHIILSTCSLSRKFKASSILEKWAFLLANSLVLEATLHLQLHIHQQCP